MLNDQLDKVLHRTDGALIETFEDRLAQAFLTLSRKQELANCLPGLWRLAEQKSFDDASTGAPNLMTHIGDVYQYGGEFLISQINCRGK